MVLVLISFKPISYIFFSIQLNYIYCITNCNIYVAILYLTVLYFKYILFQICTCACWAMCDSSIAGSSYKALFPSFKNAIKLHKMDNSIPFPSLSTMSSAQSSWSHLSHVQNSHSAPWPICSECMCIYIASYFFNVIIKHIASYSKQLGQSLPDPFHQLFLAKMTVL